MNRTHMPRISVKLPPNSLSSTIEEFSENKKGLSTRPYGQTSFHQLTPASNLKSTERSKNSKLSTKKNFKTFMRVGLRNSSKGFTAVHTKKKNS